MKKALIRLTGLMVTAAIAMSGNGMVLAATVESTGNETGTSAEETTAETTVEGANEEATAADEKPSEDTKGDEAKDDKTPATEETTKNNGNNSPVENSTEETSIDSAAKPKTENSETKKNDVAINDKEERVEVRTRQEASNTVSATSTGSAFDYGSIIRVATEAYNGQPDTIPVYNYLYQQIKNIAAGKSTSTEIAVPLSKLTLKGTYSYKIEDVELSEYNFYQGADQQDIYDALDEKLVHTINYSELVKVLTQACPYELYWFNGSYESNDTYFTHTYDYTYNSSNKTITINEIIFKFEVAKDYRGSNEYTVNSTYVQNAKAAASNADKIIAKYKNCDDIGKLLGYRDEIISLVSFDEAAYSILYNDYKYGNSWQMINVFDGNSNTNVISDGYCRAFQYLCDHTVFSNSSIYAITVFGQRSGSNHVWNVVHMSDGKNYIVDLEACDLNDKDAVFMKGATNNSGHWVTSGYNADYTYCLDLTERGFTSADLNVAETSYYYENSEPEDLDPSFNTKHGMIFNDCIGVRFIIDFPANFDPTNCYVTFTTPAGRENIVTYEESVARNNDGTSRYFACYINALELADYITATIHYGDDKELTSDSYSALDYINVIKSTNAPDSKVVVLLNDLQAFGYYCQQAGFSDNRKHENIPAPAKTLTSADIESTKTAVASYVMNKQLGSSGIDSNIKIALALTSKTELRISVKPSAGVTIKSTGYTVRTINGETYYQFAIGNIGPKALGDPKTFTIITDKGTATINVPAINYVKAVLDNDSFTTNQKYAVVAYYNYFCSAKAY